MAVNLPTAEHTVIRVTWLDGRTSERVQTLQGPVWHAIGTAFLPEHLAEDISHYEVLSEPRANLVPEVLDTFEREMDKRHWSTDTASVAEARRTTVRFYTDTDCEEQDSDLIPVQRPSLQWGNRVQRQVTRDSQTNRREALEHAKQFGQPAVSRVVRYGPWREV